MGIPVSELGNIIVVGEPCIGKHYAHYMPKQSLQVVALGATDWNRLDSKQNVENLNKALNVASAGSAATGQLYLTVAVNAVKFIVNNSSRLNELLNQFGNKDNTTPFPGGFIPYWKYFPGGPNYGKTVVPEPTNIGFARGWDNQHKPYYTAAGIPDMATLDSLFAQYAPGIIASGNYPRETNGNWTPFFSLLKSKYDTDRGLADEAIKKFAGDSNGFSMASTSTIMLILLVLIAAGAVYGKNLGNKSNSNKQEVTEK